jgi:hypothetical protein
MEFEVKIIFRYVGNYTDNVFFNCYGIYTITIIAACHRGERKTKHRRK